MVVFTTRFYRLRAWQLVPRLSYTLGTGFLLLLGPTSVINAQAQLIVTSATPANEVAAARTTNVVATFNQTLSNTPATQGALKVFSQQAGGRKAGITTVAGSTLTFDPTTNFKAGETVSGTVTTAVQGSSGTLTKPQVFQFTTATDPSTGTFGAAQTLTTKEGTRNVAVGDVNGDGYLDLLTSNGGSTFGSSISVRLNNGQGGFGASTQEVTGGTSIYDFSLADMDADGDLDLVAVSYDPARVSVRFNNGSGFFSGSPDTDLRISVYLSSLTVGDLDGDGDQDLVFANAFGNIYFRLNAGNGTSFDGGSSINYSGFFLKDLKLADVDNDGDLDLAAFGSLNGDNVGLFRNNGDGTFGATPESILISNTPSTFSTVDFGDVDKDGDLDLATGTGLLRNNGNGTFGAPQTSAAGIKFGDVDGDGDLDLLLPTSATEVSVRLNNGSGTFTDKQQVTVGGTTDLALADVDGNNTLDLLTVGNTSASVALNQPAVASVAPTLTSVTPSISPVGSTVVLTGTNFTGTTRVTFNGVASTFVVNSTNQITATVPAGATSGPIVVTTASGSNSGLNFTVGTRPAVVSTSPTPNSPSTSRATPITVTFDQPLTAGSGIEQALSVFSQQAGGKKTGTRTVSGNTLTFTPTAGFKAGETVFSTVAAPASLSRVFQFTAATSPSTGTFSGGSEVTVGAGPSRSTTGDIDGDGDLDLVVSNTNITSTSTTNSITVRLNNGNGTFTNGQEFNGSGSVVLADVDGDTDLDLLTAGGGNPGVSVYLNTSGAFTFYRAVTVLDGLTDFTVGDVDADGDLDLITTAYGLRPGSVSVRLNDGNANFLGGQDITSDVQRTYDVAVGDVDGDGDLDFVTSNLSGNSVTVYSNNGSGVFNYGSVVSFSSGDTYIGAVALGDIDKDGDLDIVSTKGNSSLVNIGLNNGTGTFTTRQLPAPARLNSVSLGDVDGDGDLDFVTSTDTGTLVWVNSGAASFSTTQTVAAVRNAILSDIDNDGDLDLLGPDGPEGSKTFGIRLNQNAPSGPLMITSLAPARNAVAAARTTDVAVTFNQPLSNTTTTQGALKVYGTQGSGLKTGTASVSGSTLTFNPNADFKPGETVFTSVLTSVQGSGGQSFAKGQVFQFTAATAAATATFSGSEVAAGAGANGTATGDIDGDGDLDLLTANMNAGTVSIRLNNGSGTFTSSQEVSTDSGPYAVTLGDVDSDGDLDFVTANANRRTVSVRFNTGNGTFVGSLNIAVGVSPHAVALGDIDADGDLDLLAANYTDGTENNVRSLVSVRLNNGLGGFSGSQEVSIGTRPLSLVLGDVDNDGDLDFATANSNSNTASVRLNDGTGTFSGIQDVQVGYQPHGVVLADVDKDGDLDLLAAHLIDSGVSVRLNNGTGSFSGTQEVAVEGARSLATGDVDGDNDLDLLVGNVWGNTVAVRVNSGTGAFSGSLNVPVGTAVSDVRVGDLDGNGTLDFVTANANSNSASVRLNASTAAAASAKQVLAYSARTAQELSVYPNPAHARVQVQLPLDLAPQTVQVSLRNSLGQVVLEQKLASQATTELQLTSLPTGVYSLQVRTTQGLLHQRLVIE